MPISALIHQVFGHFQNLNLLALLHDLQSSEIAHHAWSSSGRLCPVAHGLPAGTKVRELTRLGQAANLDVGCDFRHPVPRGRSEQRLAFRPPMG